MKNPFRRNRTTQQIGADAKRLLDDELYGQSFAAVEDAIKSTLLDARIESESDKTRVINLVLRWQNLAGARKWLDNQVQYGRLAESQANDKELAEKAFFNRGGL